MSKSGGGGGLKGHDKGGGGSKVKLMKQQQSLESAIDKVPDVIVCPKDHRMKFHSGSKREGPLTCDGPDDLCCGHDGEGVLEVGDMRYSCVECDFDICESCVKAETEEPLTPEQEKAAARQRLREKLGRGAGACKEKDDEAKRQAAKRAAVESAVAEAKAAAAAVAAAGLTAEATAESLAPGDAGSPEAKKKAAATRKKQAQKQRRGGATAESAEPTEQSAASPLAAVAAAAPGDASTPLVAAAKPFSFNLCTPPASKLNLNTPPALRPVSGGADSSDDSSDSEAEEADAAAAAAGGEGGQQGATQAAREAEAAIGKDGLLKAPENPLYCPFTQRIMRDPVVLSDGHTYERQPAEKYLAQFGTSPRTGKKLASKAVLPNLMARELCACALQLEL